MKKFLDIIQINSVKFYLILANIILVIFAIWFSNVGLLPFANTGDFLFFALLALILAVYRPGWAFVLFIGSIALENVNLAPKSFGLAIRPYQFFGALTIIALLIQIIMKRLPFELPKWKWYDVLAIIFSLAGFLSVLGAINKGTSLKQSAVALSFIALYFLVRVYIQSFEDLKRIIPFFLSSAVVIALYGILQNILFIYGGNSFEVMPGRPNGTFAEADWFGIYLVFALAVLFAIIYFKNKMSLPVIGYWALIVLIYISLLLTVSRSAWLGAFIIGIGFLKITLMNESLSPSEWDWKKFLHELRNISAAFIFGLILVYTFHLTNFQIGNRAASTGGLQKITIACSSGETAPQQIANIDQLAQYGCRFINLEDIEKEKTAGNNVSEIYRTDPNINIRANIYQKSIAEIKQYPILGIGWGNISSILGTDERGAGLNASNIFLEVWLGSGLLGILAFVILLGYIFIKGLRMYLDRNLEDKNIAAFILLGWVAIVIPNLFNSGIFLGFVWVYLAIAISLIKTKE